MAEVGAAHSKWVEVDLEDIEDIPAVGSPAVSTLVEDSLDRSQAKMKVRVEAKVHGQTQATEPVVQSTTGSLDVSCKLQRSNQKMLARSSQSNRLRWPLT